MSQQRRKSRRARSQRQQNRRKQKGGNTGDWAKLVYDQQPHSGPNGNVVHMNNLSGVAVIDGSVASNASPVTGGSRSPQSSPQTLTPVHGGKGILTDVAVPAVLLYANQALKSRKTAVKKHNKKRFSRKFRRY